MISMMYVCGDKTALKNSLFLNNNISGLNLILTFH